MTLDEAPRHGLDGFRCGPNRRALGLARIFPIDDRREKALGLAARLGKRRERGVADRNRNLLAVNAGP
jgi:hypothetical protein